MRLGIFVETSRMSRGSADIDAYVASVQAVADAGFASAWSPQVFGMDALTALALAGREVPGIELGTSVVPIYPQHPVTLAQHALTTQFAVGGRLVLGLGLSHQIVVENMWGYSFDKPAKHMEEYLDVLQPLVSTGKVAFQGSTVKAQADLRLPEGTDVPVMLAALGPRMLHLAGSRTEGTITWMTGPETIANHIAPTIAKAAADAGRPAPRVVMALPVAVVDDEAEARSKAGQLFAMYGMLPSYRAMLDREGAGGPADVAIVGDKASVQRQVSALAEKGATDFVAAPFDNREATFAALAELL
jgi:F420-dependent oxidoreductase-like protein